MSDSGPQNIYNLIHSTTIASHNKSLIYSRSLVIIANFTNPAVPFLSPSMLRSAVLTKKLHSLAPEREVYNLEGSIFKWANEGRPIVDPEGAPADGVHPYSRAWGWALNGDLWKWQ